MNAEELQAISELLDDESKCSIFELGHDGSALRGATRQKLLEETIEKKEKERKRNE